MNNILQDIQKLAMKKRVPSIEPGMTVRIHQKIKEGDKQRIQIFEGLVIKINSGFGADKSITVRKVVDGIGVEKVYPVYSPNIEKIEIKKKSKVRRAKLYYMRDRSGKSARLKESFVSDKEVEESIEELAAQTKTEEAEEGQTEAERQEIEGEPAVEVEELEKTEEAPVEEVAVAEEAPVTEEAPAEEEKKEEKSE